MRACVHLSYCRERERERSECIMFAHLIILFVCVLVSKTHICEHVYMSRSDVQGVCVSREIWKLNTCSVFVLCTRTYLHKVIVQFLFCIHVHTRTNKWDAYMHICICLFCDFLAICFEQYISLCVVPISKTIQIQPHKYVKIPGLRGIRMTLHKFTYLYFEYQKQHRYSSKICKSSRTVWDRNASWKIWRCQSAGQLHLCSESCSRGPCPGLHTFTCRFSAYMYNCIYTYDNGIYLEAYIDWCAFYYSVRNSLVALLDSLFATRFFCQQYHEWRVIEHTFVDGYCSTVQGLLDWFEVDLGFTELSFIQIDSEDIENTYLHIHTRTHQAHSRAPVNTSTFCFCSFKSCAVTRCHTMSFHTSK